MEISFELTPDDYPDVQRLDKRPPWALLLAIGVMTPSLISLWIGGFRFTLGIVAAVLSALIYSGFRAADRLRRKKFVRHRCAPIALRACSDYLEIDGIVEWRRMDWAYLEDVQCTRGWLVLAFYEGEPLLVPPRACDDEERMAFLTLARQSLESAKPRDQSHLADYHEFQDRELRTATQYTIDNDYMRGLVDLRFTDKVGWARVLVVVALTILGCVLWRKMTRQIASAGAAIALPLAIMRGVESVMRNTALKRSHMEFDLSMELALHDEGYERRCRLFQSFTSWSLVKSVQIHDRYLIFSHADDEHLLAPVSAWSSLEAAEAFRDEAVELGRALSEELRAIDADPPDADS